MNRICLAVLTARANPETDMRKDCSTEEEAGRLCGEAAGSITQTTEEEV